MTSRPPLSRGKRGSVHDGVVRRVPLAMSVALEVVAELRARALVEESETVVRVMSEEMSTESRPRRRPTSP